MTATTDTLPAPARLLPDDVVDAYLRRALVVESRVHDKREDEDPAAYRTRILAAMADQPNVPETVFSTSADLGATARLDMERARSRESRGREAALAAGVADLPEVERAWIAEDPTRQADLSRRLLAAQADLDLQAGENFGTQGPDGERWWRTKEEQEAARAEEERRYDLHAAQADALFARPDRDGARVRAAWVRTWREGVAVSRRWRAKYGPTWEELDERVTRALEDGLDAGLVPAFHFAGLLRSRANLDYSFVAEVDAAALWEGVREGWRAENAPALAARYVVSALSGAPPDAEGRLALAVQERLRSLSKDGNLPRDYFGTRPPGVSETGEIAGMFYRDELAARYFDALGPRGSPLRDRARRYAEAVREAGRARWASYRNQLDLPGSPPENPAARWASFRLRFPGQLAEVLWEGEVRERVELDARNPPALALVVVNDVEQVWYTQGRQFSFLPEGRGQGAVRLQTAQGEELATTALLPANELENLQRGALLFRSYMGHLAVRGFAERGWEQTRTATANPSFLGWEGGYDACAQALGAKSKKAAEELRDILLAGQGFRREWADGEFGGLWTFSNDAAKGHRKSYLEVRLGRPLMPYMVKALGPRERTLVPVVKMPPRVGGRANEWAAQAAFQFALVRAMVERRVEVAQEGGAKLSPEELARMARAVGLPDALLARVLDRWTHDGDDGLACLAVVGRDRYVLPDNEDFREARAFIEAGGRRSLQRSRAGRASVRAGTAPRRRRKAKDPAP